MGDNHQPMIHWQDGVPVSSRFGDPYFSLENGLAETRHVFLAGNGLPARFRTGFRIAELGFGTGLNMLAALHAWIAEGTAGPLDYTAFEAYPMPAGDLARALAGFPDLADLSAPLVAAWTGHALSFETPSLRARVVIGDARETLRVWSGQADAWFLDGFAPAKNPELWQDDLLTEVARHSAPGGTFATYSAAGHVRRALAAAGCEGRRRPGYGRKRHMTAGRLP